MNNDRKPDWTKWKLFPSVELWQATALWLDIDPDKVKHSHHGWMADDHLFDEGDELKRRLDIVKAHAGVAFPLVVQRAPLANSSVALTAFAVWAVNLSPQSFSVPAELSNIAATINRQEALARPTRLLTIGARMEGVTVKQDSDQDSAHELLKHYRYMHYWSWHEAARLLLGLVPVDTSSFDISPSTGGEPALIYRRIKDAVERGELRGAKTNLGLRVIAAEVVRWAILAGINVPEIFRDLPSELEKPEKQTEGGKEDLSTKERTTALLLVGALAKLAKIDISSPSKAAEVILSTVEQMGAAISKRTIETWLDQVSAAIAHRAK